ncbi:MAG: hypothetical protein HYX51_03450 [Chloroflexi bacterium]|nr:hypothetical protein [Chloroflexota bacterium]
MISWTSGRAWRGAVAAGALMLGVAAGVGSATPIAPAYAEDAGGDGVLFAFRASEESAYGRTFSLTTATATPAGSDPPSYSPVTGRVEICAKSEQGRGRLLVFFSDETEAEFSGDGCEQRELAGVTSVSVNALRGNWDIVVRRTEPVAGETTLAGFVLGGRGSAFGFNFALATAEPSPAGTPAAIKPYTGGLEICIKGPQNLGQARALVDDTVALTFTGQGCQQTSASGALSVTIILDSLDCNVVIRRLG